MLTSQGAGLCATCGNIVVDYRWAEGRYERLAAELRGTQTRPHRRGVTAGDPVGDGCDQNNIHCFLGTAYRFSLERELLKN
jgi:hypothetical protein